MSLFAVNAVPTMYRQLTAVFVVFIRLGCLFSDGAWGIYFHINLACPAYVICSIHSMGEGIKVLQFRKGVMVWETIS